MDKNILKNSVLFKGVDDYQFNSAIQNLNIKTKSFSKDEIILHSGHSVKNMCFVTKGSVRIEINDFLGNTILLNTVFEGDFFAETYAYLSNEPLIVDVVANSKCEIMFIDISSFQNSLDYDWQKKIMSNLLQISMQKNLLLSQRSMHTTPKGIRYKLLSYLNSIAMQSEKKFFSIPFDRQQLANYLNVDRSSLSKEISKMKSEGIIDAWKNHFKILTKNLKNRH